MSRSSITRALLLSCLAIITLPAAGLAQSAFSNEMSAGREAFDGSNYSLAERHFQGAFEIAGSDGQKSTALYSLGVIAQRLGRLDEAKTRAAKAVELSPKNSQAQRLLDELNSIATDGAAKPKAVRQAAAPASAPIETGAIDRPARKPAPKETAAVAAVPKEPVIVNAAKEPAAAKAPAAKAKAEASAPKPAAQPAAASVSKLDPTSIGIVEPSGARLLWTFPADKRTVLGAGFTGTDSQIVVVSGPLADAPAGEIELKRYDLLTGTPGDAYSLHSDMKTAVVAVPVSGAVLATAIPGGAAKKQAAKSAAKTAPVSLHLWNTETVDNTEAIEMEGSDRGGGIALDHLAFSRNGKRLIAAHRGGVETFDTAGLRGVEYVKITSRRDAPNATSAMAVSANGSRVVLTNGARIRVIEAGKTRDIGPGGNAPAFDQIALSDNGGLIAASSAAGVRFYDFVSGKESEALPESPDVAAALAFSPGGDKLAVADGQRVRLWTMQGRKALVDLDAPGAVAKIAFSADGRLIMAATEKGTRVWYVDPAAITTKPAPSVAVLVPVAAAPVVTDITTASVSKPAAAPEPATAVPAPVQVAAADPPVSDPTLEKARHAAELGVERAGALERSECERVKALDIEIGNGALYPACQARVDQAKRVVEQAKRQAELQQKAALATERTAALERADCEQVKALDAQIGSNAQAGACFARIEQAKRDADQYARNALVAERKAALDGLNCDAVKTLDAKLGDGDNFTKCSFQSVLQSGKARDLYLTAAKLDADRDRVPAKQLYRAIVDRFPQDDLALKAAERLTVISDQEAREVQTGSVQSGSVAPATAADTSVDPLRRGRPGKPRP